MTQQNQIIMLCILIFIAVPVGTFVTIKTINKLSRPPVNTLTRDRGDIELIDYIEPLQPAYTYHPNQIDLENNLFPVLERISYPPTYYTGANPPSYRSGTLPYYQSVDGININFGLEKAINIDFIWWLILIIMILISYHFLYRVKGNNWVCTIEILWGKREKFMKFEPIKEILKACFV